MNPDPATTDPTTSASAERWVLIVRSEPGQDVPIGVRVKRWLKCGLRGFGIRCESASATTLPEQLAASRAEVLELRERLARAEARAATRPKKAKAAVA